MGLMSVSGQSLKIIAQTTSLSPVTIGNKTENLVDFLTWMPGWQNTLPPGKYSLRLNFFNVDVGQVRSVDVQITNAEILNKYDAWSRLFIDFEVKSSGAAITLLVNGFNRKFEVSGFITKGIFEDGVF